MDKQFKDVKSEKTTFMVVIGLLLFSLIYLSIHSVLVKDEIRDFRKEIEAINSEMNLLLELMPIKDSTIEIHKEKIALQGKEIKEALAKNVISEQDKEELLRKLKEQFNTLKNQAKQVISSDSIINQKKENKASYALIEQKDTLLQAKEKEIAQLRRMIESLRSKKPEVISHNKLSAYYFIALSSDKKNRSGKTSFLMVQLQLKGDLQALNNKYLRIEVRDPSNSIISSEKDRIQASAHYTINYKFEPYRHKFIKGRYSIRVYSEDNEFQTVTFLTLV